MKNKTEIEYNKTAAVTYHMNEKRKKKNREGEKEDLELFHT